MHQSIFQNRPVTTGVCETVLYRFKYDSEGSCGFNCYLTPVGELGRIYSITGF